MKTCSSFIARDGDRDIYFVSTQKHHGFDVKAAFRVTGKTPRLWHPESGEIEPVSYTTEQGQTVVPLHFDAQGSVFVVFEGSGAAPSRTAPARSTAQQTRFRRWPVEIDVSAQSRAHRQRPIFPLSPHGPQAAMRGVKYFSGTATYHKQSGRAQGLVQAGSQGDARSRDGEGDRGSRDQWQAGGRSSVEASVSRRRDAAL